MLDHRPLMRLRLVGTTELVRASTAETVLSSGKPLAFLAYLSAAPGRSLTRGALISILWADLEPDAAKHALRQTLYYLRRQTGEDLVIVEGDVLRLSPAVASDREDLLTASLESDHDRVIALYAGPFMPYFAAPGGGGFEGWAALERRRLLEIFRHSAESIIGARLSRGRAREAIDLARRLRDQDLFNESGWRLLIETCTSAHDLLAAKSEAEALQQLADREDFEPEPATRAAIRGARLLSANINGNNHRDAGQGASITPGLVGREAAFAALLDAWEATRSGALTRVHVTARAGIGKSRLLREVGARIRGLRGKVLTLGGNFGSRDIPYAVASDLAAALASLPGKRALSTESAATLVALNPSLSTYFDEPPRHSSTDDTLRTRTLALRELLAAVSFEQPVAILIDDVHWWDEATTALVAAVVDGVGHAKVLLVTTGRPEARRVSLVATEATRQIVLEPLTEAQVEELLLSIATLPPAEWASRFATDVWRASRGSPLLTLELLQLLEDRELLRREEGQWRSDKPDALRAELSAGDVLRARLEDMDRVDRWLLTILAATGGPVERATLFAAADRPESEVAARLAPLEARGLIVRDADGWRIAHDELAEELLRLAGHDAIARASAQIGRALSAVEPFSETGARRAAQLLRAGEDENARGELLRRFASNRFAVGDRRPVGALAAELFGASLPEADLARLVRGMPWMWRLGLISRPRQVLAAVSLGLVVLAASLGLIIRSSRPSPDAVLGIALLDSTGLVTFQQIGLHASGWTPREPLVAQPWREVAPFWLASMSPFGAVWDAHREQLYTIEAVDDPGVTELVARGRDGSARRVAAARGDDVSPSLSPDGTRLVFVTARWNALSRYDLALHSLVDGTTIPLTSGPASDHTPVWSPNGIRIAFARNNWGERPNELCVIVVATRELECRALPDGNAQVVGWVSSDRVMYHLGAGLRAIQLIQWSSGETDRVLDDARGVALSPDGRWVFCLCATAATGARGPVVFPLAAPFLARKIILPGEMSELSAAFWVRSQEALAAATVVIDRPAPHLPVGVPIRLTATARDDQGRGLTHLGSIRWSVSGAGGASIDSISGTIVANGTAPAIVVHASMGAVARDSVELTVSRDSAALVFEETWSDTAMSRWVAYGFPVPKVVISSRGRGNAFLNNGEGSFRSGAITAPAFDGSAGVAFDLEVSTRVTAPQWQELGVSLAQHVDTSRFSRARGHNVDPQRGGDELCGVGFPGEEQTGKVRALTLYGGELLQIRPPPAGLLDGTWHRIRVQLLPDGRCAFALDGRPIAILPGAGRALADVRAILQGNSVGTQMLVGPVRIVRGVPRDIDWTRVRVTRKSP